jgi:ABC-type Fe3+-hydroxamate transport system substrate-binding protein
VVEPTEDKSRRLAGLLAGCTSNSSSASPSGSTTPASSAPASSPAASSPATSTAAEATQSLGTIAALGKQIAVDAEGTVTAGQPATIAVKTGQKVDDVSGWLGNQGDVAKKVTCQLQTDEPQPDYDCMITIPKDVPAGAQIWIQVTSNGKSESGGVNVPKTS